MLTCLTALTAVALTATASYAAPAPAPAPAAAAAPTPGSDAWIRAEVSSHYGKPVPAAAVCIERPSLPAPFAGDIAAVAVRRGLRGCVLFGVVIDGAWIAPEAALTKALSPSWAGLDAKARSAALLAWTDGVALAFEQPLADPPGVVTAGKGGATTVTRRALRRDDGQNRSLDATTTFVYDAGLALTSATEQVHTHYATQLFVRADRVTGVPEAAVDKALADHGKVVSDCFASAWEADLTLSGRVRLSWAVADGKVGEVAVIAEPGTDDALARCYARAVRAGTYPPEVKGDVTWVFAVTRGEAAPPTATP